MKTKKQTANYSAKSEVAQFKTKKSFSHVAKRELKKAPFTAWLGMIITSAYILIAVFAPLIAPYGESEVFPIPFAPWSEEFLLGTDQIGRDILTRLIYGARNTIGIAFVTTALAFVIGVLFGLIAAITRETFIDQILGRLVDVLMAIPLLIFAATYISFNLIADIISIITNPRLLHPR